MTAAWEPAHDIEPKESGLKNLPSQLILGIWQKPLDPAFRPEIMRITEVICAAEDAEQTHPNRHPMTTPEHSHSRQCTPHTGGTSLQASLIQAWRYLQDDNSGPQVMDSGLGCLLSLSLLN
jgi:hypothetical protein